MQNIRAVSTTDVPWGGSGGGGAAGGKDGGGDAGRGGDGGGDGGGGEGGGGEGGGGSGGGGGGSTRAKLLTSGEVAKVELVPITRRISEKKLALTAVERRSSTPVPLSRLRSCIETAMSLVLMIGATSIRSNDIGAKALRKATSAMGRSTTVGCTYALRDAS